MSPDPKSVSDARKELWDFADPALPRKIRGVRSRIFSKTKEEVLMKKSKYSDAQIMAIL